MDWEHLSRSTSFSVPDRLSIDLERLILDGTLAPGDRLPSERVLSELLGVSRVSVRQGLKELENHGLIDRRPGRGTIVLAPGSRAPHAAYAMSQALGRNSEDRTLGHIMELRAILEPPIARITAGRAINRDLRQLQELVEAMEMDVSRSRYVELDQVFHQSIAQYTHNPLLALLDEQIMTLSAPSRTKALQSKARRTASSAAHRKIFEAIAAADGVLAERSALDHVLAVKTEIRRIESEGKT